MGQRDAPCSVYSLEQRDDDLPCGAGARGLLLLGTCRARAVHEKISSGTFFWQGVIMWLKTKLLVPKVGPEKILFL